MSDVIMERPIEQDLAIWFYDIEIYPNYLLLVFKSAETGELMIFETSRTPKGMPLPEWLNHKTLIGYNNLNFDDVLLSRLLDMIEENKSGQEVLRDMNGITRSIIQDDMPIFSVRESYKIKHPSKEVRWLQSIDLLRLTPLQLSLKMAGARLGWSKLQEIPIEPGTVLTPEQKEIIKQYCINDVNVTEYVYKTLRDELIMRKALEDQYDLNKQLLMRGNAALAEHVLVELYCKLTNTYREVIKNSIQRREELFVTYEAPAWIHFETEELKQLQHYFETQSFLLNEHGRLTITDVPKVYLNGKRYDCGVGGLHSKDCEGVFKADDDYEIIDWDYSSYYPTLILQGGFVPRQLKKDQFLELYNQIVLDRIKAKKEGNKTIADALKIVINSTYGKFSEPFSMLYDPKATLQTTVTGQLTLLMLIEKMHKAGIVCISANTDGATFLVHKKDKHKMGDIILAMGKNLVQNKNGLFDFGLEDTHYSAIYKRDVNTYLAFTTDGKIKNKGALLSDTGLSHNPSNNICVKAIEQWILKQIPFEDTIRDSRILKDFLTVRKVKGGAIYQDNPVGSIVRYYYHTGSDDSIYYQLSGNKVPVSEGAKLVQDLPDEFPDDIDYDKYLRLTVDLFAEIKKPCQVLGNVHADVLRKKGLSPAPLDHAGKTLFDGDFSNTLNIGIQTGHKTDIIFCDGKLWRFDNHAFPQAYKTSNRKTGLNVIYGGVIPITDCDLDHIESLPETYITTIYKSLTKPQRIKIDLASR